MGTCEIAVVVPSHDRPTRLRWLLNALEEQTLQRERWEVAVVHDSRHAETDALLRSHPLVAAGNVRAIRVARGIGPAAKRNEGWRATTAPLVLFTHDDCRPPPDWLERGLAAARAQPGAVIEGSTAPDPDEVGLLELAGQVHTKSVHPPSAWVDTSNVLFPRAVLEAAGGFDETLPLACAEGAELVSRATSTGVARVAAPELVTYHAVVMVSIITKLVSAAHQRQIPAVVSRAPELRRQLALGVFRDVDHLLLILSAVGLALSKQRRGAVLLAVPWITRNWRPHSATWRGFARSASDLPPTALVQAAEIAALAVGSARERRIVL